MCVLGVSMSPLPTIFYCILELCHMFSLSFELSLLNSGADPEFQVRGGGALNKIAPSGGRRETFWGISCEKSPFKPKNLIFSNVRPPSTGSAPAIQLQLLMYSGIFIKSNNTYNRKYGRWYIH